MYHVSKERLNEVTKPVLLSMSPGFVTSKKRSLLTRYRSRMWANTSHYFHLFPITVIVFDFRLVPLNHREGTTLKPKTPIITLPQPPSTTISNLSLSRSIANLQLTLTCSSNNLLSSSRHSMVHTHSPCMVSSHSINHHSQHSSSSSRLTTILMPNSHKHRHLLLVLLHKATHFGATNENSTTLKAYYRLKFVSKVA